MSTTMYFHRTKKVKATNHVASHCTLSFQDEDLNDVNVLFPSEMFGEVEKVAEMLNARLRATPEEHKS